MATETGDDNVQHHGHHKMFDFKKMEAVHDFLLPAVTRFMEAEARNKTVVDVGCGPGYWCYQAAKAGAKSVNGFDIQDDLVQEAKKINAEFGEVVDIRVGDANRMPYNDNTFDVAFSMYVTCHLSLEALDKHYREICRVLKPGGKALVAIHPGFHKLHVADDADETIVKQEITQALGGLPKTPSVQQITEAFNKIKGNPRACVALDKDGSIYMIEDANQLSNGQNIWRVSTSHPAHPTYFYEEQFLADQTTPRGLHIDKIEDVVNDSEVTKKSGFSHNKATLHYLSKPL